MAIGRSNTIVVDNINDKTQLVYKTRYLDRWSSNFSLHFSEMLFVLQKYINISIKVFLKVQKQSKLYAVHLSGRDQTKMYTHTKCIFMHA